MDAVIKDLISRKAEIQAEVDMLFQANMKFTDWNVPEANDKEAAKVILDMIQEQINKIKADVEAGQYDYY